MTLYGCQCQLSRAEPLLVAANQRCASQWAPRQASPARRSQKSHRHAQIHQRSLGTLGFGQPSEFGGTLLVACSIKHHDRAFVVDVPGHVQKPSASTG